MENKIIISESAANVRSIARQMLKGNWKVAALGTLIYLIGIYIPTMIISVVLQASPLASFLSFIYMILVMGALTYGYMNMMLSILRRKQVKTSDVFTGFEQYGRAFCVYILMEIFLVLWCLPYGLLLVVGSVCLVTSSIAGNLLGAILMIAAIASLILPIRASMAYSQCFFLSLDNPQMKAMEAIKTSVHIMNGNKWKLFCLYISFIGWFLLCVIPMMIISVVVSIIAVMPFAMQMANNPTLMNAYYSSPEMAQSMVMANIGSIGFAIIYLGVFVGMVGFLWLMPYMSMAGAAFYEIITGKMVVTQKLSTPNLAPQGTVIQNPSVPSNLAAPSATPSNSADVQATAPEAIPQSQPQASNFQSTPSEHQAQQGQTGEAKDTASGINENAQNKEQNNN